MAKAKKMTKAERKVVAEIAWDAAERAVTDGYTHTDIADTSGASVGRIYLPAEFASTPDSGEWFQLYAAMFGANVQTICGKDLKGNDL
jgi:uncharacterized membrane-anchored protein